MIWACFLHFYQPPTQKRYWVDRITDESYRRLVKGLLAEPRAKITLNINSILCELWEQYGHHDVLEGVKTLVQRGQIELTGSAKFHPLLPKLPKEQVVRQIRLNEESLNKYFSIDRPSGFFPPEMAYDRNLAQIVADLGYEWVIAEELSLGKAVEYDRIYEVAGIKSHVVIASEARQSTTGSPRGVTPRDDKEGQGLKIFFRDRAFSYKLLAGYLGTEKLFLDDLHQRFPQLRQEDSGSLIRRLPESGNARAYLLTAMDGETFGHHRPGMEQLLFQLFKIQEMEMIQISQLPNLFKKTESVETKPSTWALMEHEVEKNLPFARWDDPENAVHKLQWELTNLAIETVSTFSHADPESSSGLSASRTKSEIPKQVRDDVGDNNKAQSLLDRALHSDQYWWASAKPWWSLEYIERGAKELLESVKATGRRVESEKAQDLYYKILETAFEYQRSGKVDEISHAEDETIRMRTDQSVPKMPKEELLKIIETIRKEMLSVVEKQEYERAAQLRDRIKELESYLI